MQQALKIGHALAYLSTEVETNQTASQVGLSATASAYLQSLREIRQEIQSGNHRIPDIIDSLPQASCRTDETYLRNNHDFLIALLLICRDDGHDSEHCNRIYRHLNDCFRCFEEFCQLLRDYQHKSQELLKN